MSNFTELKDWYLPLNPNQQHRLPRYKTRLPVGWDVGKEGSGFTIKVPVGYIFDVSVPRLFHWLIDPDDTRFLKAACLHDYLLEQGWTRVSSAGALSDALLATGVSRMKRLIMVLAVIVWKWK